jgi:hypothetical protein
MVVLTWLAVEDDALLMVGVAGGGQLVVPAAVTAEQPTSP